MSELNAQAMVQLLDNLGPADAAVILAEAIRGYCEGSDRIEAKFEPDAMMRLVQKQLDDG